MNQAHVNDQAMPATFFDCVCLIGPLAPIICLKVHDYTQGCHGI